MRGTVMTEPTERDEVVEHVEQFTEHVAEHRDTGDQDLTPPESTGDTQTDDDQDDDTDDGEDSTPE
jgi:hypothetical protein